MSRTENSIKNFVYSTANIALIGILSFIIRTVFVNILGNTYLGINGIFTNILSVLSLTELGIGATINFSLYKPLADNDIQKIKSLMKFYKIAYQYISIIITIIGLILIPFLKYLIKGAEGIENIRLIYLIFLFNTVSSYLLSYKTTLMIADQKNYYLIKWNTAIDIIIKIIQLFILIIFKNFIGYLLVESILSFFKRILINYFIDKNYHYLREKNVTKLSYSERKIIFNKLKSMLLHNIGGICINQTDNIIISSFINVISVGLISNYTMIISLVNKFIQGFFDASNAGLGNIIVTKNPIERLKIYEKYDFLSFIFYGVSSILLYFLLTPFINLWLGKDSLIDNFTVGLLCVNFYLTGRRVPLGNIKTAAGVFEPDKFSPIIQAIINLIVSIIGAIYIGIPGVYIGTLLSSLVPNLWRPIVVYKYIFNSSSKLYFKTYFCQIFIIIFDLIIIKVTIDLIYISNIYIKYCIDIIICMTVSFLSIFVVYKDSEEYLYIINTVRNLLKKE